MPELHRGRFPAFPANADNNLAEISNYESSTLPILVILFASQLSGKAGKTGKRS